MGAFHEHGSHAGPTWPAAALDHNLPLRASCGLTALYAAVNRTRGPELAATAVAPPVKRLHETFPDGTLCLAPDMPLLARRYRFMHAISETDLSQVICATDTYCECERAADGRRQPLVAIKVLNAKHWILGAQEYTRMRLLRKRQDAEGVHVPIAGATSCFEVGCHFCILQPLLATLDHEAARCRLCGPPGAAPPPPLAGRGPGAAPPRFQPPATPAPSHAAPPLCRRRRRVRRLARVGRACRRSRLVAAAAGPGRAPPSCGAAARRPRIPPTA